MNTPAWKYNELELTGTDFCDVEKVKGFDERHSKFRDYKQETEERLQALNLPQDAEVIDLGCGTGAFALNAASNFKKIYAVDISAGMLEYLKQRAEEKGISNIECRQGGFLSYNHEGTPVDGIISSLVLHHLPDFWKQIALKRVYGMLKPGGKFYLFDVVFSFPLEEYEQHFDEWVKAFAEKMDEQFAGATANHLKREYSTFSWILEGMLERAGFTITSAQYEGNGMMAKYLCEK